MSNENAKIDENSKRTLIGVTDDPNAELRRLLIDPATGRLKVSATVTGEISGDFSNGGDIAGSVRRLGNIDDISLQIIIDDIVLMHFADSQNVGIGDSTPNGRLEVVGNNNPFDGLSVANNYMQILRHKNNITGNASGLGFSISSADGNIGGAIIVKRTGSNGQGEMQFYTKESTAGQGLPIKRMTIANDGKIIIEGELQIKTAIPSIVGQHWVATDNNGNGEWADANKTNLVFISNFNKEFVNGTVVTDNSGAGNDAVISANVIHSPNAGSYGGGVVDFANSVDDKISITDYKGILGNNPRTITAWVKVTSLTEQDIVGWGVNVLGKKSVFRLDATTVQGSAVIRFEVNTGYMVGTKNIADGDWHHVAMTFVGGSIANTKLYVDGVEDVPSLIRGRIVNTDWGENVLIGNSSMTTGRKFLGEMDEVSIYDKAISADEIFNLYLNRREALVSYPEELTKKVISPKTSNFSVGQNESNTVFTTEGSFEEITGTLPSAVAGLTYSFYNIESIATMRVQANTGDTIRISTEITVAGGSINGSDRGAFIKLTAINATEWVAESVVGIWAFN